MQVDVSTPLHRGFLGSPLWNRKQGKVHRFLSGTPGLTGANLLRVSKANVLYHFTAKLIREALSLKKLVCCENPKNSFFWKTSFINQLSHPDLQTQLHQACAYGSSRPKWTTLLFNHTAFSAISKVCPGESTKPACPLGPVADRRVCDSAGDGISFRARICNSESIP